MEYGALIKYYRTQRGITQAELAKGICSVPHLSKIENNSKEANKETISLLLKRLNVNVEEMEEKESFIQDLLGDLEEKINYYLIDKVDETYRKLLEIEHIIPFSKHIYKYELYKYRYLLFKGYLAEAAKQKELLFKQRINFSQHEEYLYNYFNAIFLMMKGKFKAADELFDALDIEPSTEKTKAEYFYHRAHVKAALEQSGHAIHFGKLALQLFMNEHNFFRILHSLMLLGINYTHSNIYEEAEECFRHLIRNAELLKQEKLLPQIYHNMGFLQNKKYNPKKALSYYEKSLALQPINNPHYLVTLYAIGEIQYSLGEAEKAKECFNVVSSLAKELGNKKYRLLAEFYLIHMHSPDRAFKYLVSKVIPHLEETNEHKNDLTRFYKMLSDYYTEQGMYLEAVKYLNKIT
ncbi:helix-turn-helix domain-containing protein [Neobacillus sedimentimangrovi]|uniref:Helix-turn-helix domain-containing protein n=1 Tax=Neobacillus sedimentimangrovi TaxID=2699460 RepID=A0ABS8QI46_9BACI|nr:helix-turn-helix transcriptional regulator [Neobacillus sedimentimangrovi]MCD4838943.1 helix-turn-helix domain-containing protein [Neobacillus sedimentimangrovi]